MHVSHVGSKGQVLKPSPAASLAVPEQGMAMQGELGLGLGCATAPMKK